MVCTPGRVDISNTQAGEQCFLFIRRIKGAGVAPSFFTLHFSVTSALGIYISKTEEKEKQQQNSDISSLVNVAVKLHNPCFSNSFLPF